MSIEQDELTFDEPSSNVASSDGFQCPGCDRSDFKSERGMRKHATQMHGITVEGTEDSTPEGSTTKRTRKSNLQPKLEALFLSIGMIVSFKCAFCGTEIIGKQAPALAKAWDNLAKENPAVRVALNKLLATSAWGEVAMVTAMTIIPIAEHHNFSIMPKPRARPTSNSQVQPDNAEEYLAKFPPTN